MAARILVPLALLACVGAVVALVADNMSASEDPAQERQRPAQRDGQKRDREKKEKPKEYVVESGDTLSGISEKTGVPIDRLIRRNPDLDPRVLNAGQVIKLR